MFRTEDEIRAIVSGFESCETDKAAFRHQDHLVIVVVYLSELTIPQAIERLRTSLLRFVDHHNVDRRKYNETITTFWTEIVAEALGQMPESLTLAERCNHVIQAYPGASLALDYYSSELLFSDVARETFVKPDLKDWKVR